MRNFLEKYAPVIFVCLWSTGFLGAKLGLPHAEPFTFLSLRFAIVLMILLPIGVFFVKETPSIKQVLHCFVVGILLHGAYLGGVFFAIAQGMPSGLSALIVGQQPVITLLFSAILARQLPEGIVILGFALGFAGVFLVLLPQFLNQEAITAISLSSIIASILALFGISAGTVYQKTFVKNVDSVVGLMFQYFAALIVLGILSILTESQTIVWDAEFVFALVWLIFVLSLGGVGYLMFLIERGSVAKTSSLFFLVPGITALVAHIVFDEPLGIHVIVGFALAAISVILVQREAK